MSYATIKFYNLEDKEWYEVEVHTDDELGQSLNALQDAVWYGAVDQVEVIPIHENAKNKAALFNKMAGTKEKQQQSAESLKETIDKQDEKLKKNG